MVLAIHSPRSRFRPPKGRGLGVNCCGCVARWREPGDARRAQVDDRDAIVRDPRLVAAAIAQALRMDSSRLGRPRLAHAVADCTDCPRRGGSCTLFQAARRRPIFTGFYSSSDPRSRASANASRTFVHRARPNGGWTFARLLAVNKYRRRFPTMNYTWPYDCLLTT